MAYLILMAGCDQPPSSTVAKAKATQDPLAADVDWMEAYILQSLELVGRDGYVLPHNGGGS